MSRLKDALMSLLGQCTPAGTEPDGNNVDEILECMAAHFNGGRTIFYGKTADKRIYLDEAKTIQATKQDVEKALTAGNIYLKIDDEGAFRSPYMVWVGSADHATIRVLADENASIVLYTREATAQ